MADFYHDASRALQDRFDTRRLADRIEQRLVASVIGDSDKAFIESLDMFFLATTDAAGQPSCSYKGGDRGFVRVIDPATLVFPSYDGNGMFLTLGNMLQNPRVGMLFIDFQRQRRLRLSGIASIDHDDPLRAGYKEAQLMVRVTVTRVFPNCPRYIHHYELVERSPFVPRADAETPVPNWKKSDWACDVLPVTDAHKRDPAN